MAGTGEPAPDTRIDHQAGASTGETLKAQLDKISFDGVTGHISFDKNGDVSGNFQVSIIKDGKPQLQK